MARYPSTNRNAVTGEPIPGLRIVDHIYPSLHALCSADSIYRSRLRTYRMTNPDKDEGDFLHFVQKAHRDAGTMPTFSSLRNYADWVLSLPEPREWKDQ